VEDDMPAYSYAIKIDREPKTIQFHEEHEFFEPLTLAFLRKYVREEDTFEIDDETGYLVVYKNRLETPEETAARVAKEESYMAEYERWKESRVVSS
jgi:hypothetical protein